MSFRRSPFAIAACVLSCLTLTPCGLAQDDLADVVERCEQAVVKIQVQGSGGGEHLGSGFLIDPAGTLVTNVHVLAGAQRAIATFANGAKIEIKGTLVIDPARDICIAKVDGNGFPALSVASALPRKGERVTALGSPQGLDFSATTGIVSAIRPAAELGPEIGRPEMQGTWIQVDAALSGGNSGGPLINNKGEVVGMSTLASQGAAQNLNFGISAADILQLYQTSSSQPLVSLPDGVAKLDPDAGSPRKGLAERPPVPKESLARYVRDSQASFDELLRGMRQELSRSTGLLKDMRKGDSFLPPQSPPTAEVVRLINPRTKKTAYFFRNQGVKDREVSRLQTRIRELQTVDKGATSSTDKDSLFALLSKYGPRLDPRRKESIGFLFDAQVLLAFDDHGVIILYDSTPYLLWIESAAGLSEGSDLNPMPVYVAGTQTVEVSGQPPRVVTLLYAVTEAELRSAIYGEEPKGVASEWRFWKDQTGKFQVEAQLVQMTTTNVVLKKRDGSTITVPLLRLSTADREFLSK